MEFTTNELKLIELFRQLPKSGKASVIAAAKAYRLTANERYLIDCYRRLTKRSKTELSETAGIMSMKSKEPVQPIIHVEWKPVQRRADRDKPQA